MDAIWFINGYGKAILIGLQVIIGVLLYVWLKPFLFRKRTAVYVSVLYTVFMMVWEFSPVPMGSMAQGIICVPVLIGVLYFLERKNLEQKIFLIIIFLAIRQVTIAAACEINFFISDLMTHSSFLMTNAMALLVSYVIQELVWAGISTCMLYFAIRLFQKVFAEKHENMTLSELVIMLTPALPIFLERQLWFQYHKLWDNGIISGVIDRNYPGNVVFVFYDIVAYILLVVVVWLYQKNKTKSEERKELALLESNREALEEHIKQTEKLYEAQRSLRHDLANHIQTMERLVSAGEIAASREYLNHMQDELSKMTKRTVTGNPVVDIVLDEYMELAEESGINCEVQFGYPGDTKLSAFDVSVILSNALSNAIRAAGECEKSYIRVNTVRRKNILLICVSNNYAGRLGIDEETGLPDRITGHGIGLKNIRHTAEKYQGAMEIELTRNGDVQEFCLTVMLQVQ